MEPLDELRTKIDDIDNAIIAKLAERFKITNQVGEYKTANNLPAKDTDREAKQYQRITELALQHDLDPAFAEAFLAVVIERVIQNHEEIAQNS
ncbi:MAG: chorismate mutase [Gammaproteobacteria bacterium]|nr:chorismate mutase [Gammaproteobacteria bacterium]